MHVEVLGSRNGGNYKFEKKRAAREREDEAVNKEGTGMKRQTQNGGSDINKQNICGGKNSFLNTEN